MAFDIPGFTQPSRPTTTQRANPSDQLRPPDSNIADSLSLASPVSMAPDSVKLRDAPSSLTYDADVLHRAGVSAHAITAVTTAAAVGAAERLGPALGQLGSEAAAVVGGAARAALPIAGETLGAAALVIATQDPAGETEADLAKTRALDAAGRQRLEAAAHPAATEPQHTTFPGQRIDIGPNHTTNPTHVRAAKDGILTTPADTRAKVTYTGHASHPDLHQLTKPTGTAIHQPSAADQATLAEREKIVTPAHAAHLTPNGTLANADHAVGIDEKLVQYSLNDQHADGMHKARVFKSVLGYDRHNIQELRNQIKEGIQREPAIPGEVDEHGVRFTVDIPVTGPAGAATIRTGWIYRPEANAPRMITGFVK